METQDRATAIRVRLYGLFGHGYVTRAAEGIGMSRQHISRVLNNQFDSSETLDKLESWAEREQQTTAEAA